MSVYRNPRKRSRTPSHQGAVSAAPASPLQVAGAIPSRKARRKSPEADLQAQVVTLLRLALEPPWTVYFVPNGGNLSQAQAAKFQKMGLLAGVHDLHIIGPGFFGTLEIKAPTKRPSTKSKLRDEQQDFANILDACGHPWAEVSSLEAAFQQVGMWVLASGSRMKGARI